MTSFSDFAPRARYFLTLLPAILILTAVMSPDASAAKARKAAVAKPAATATVVTLTAPAASATVSGTVSISAQAGTGVSWINIYIDGSYLASSPPLTVAWDSTTVLNGTHTISANAYSSSATLLGSASVTVTVANASAPPPVTITAPANNATVSGTVSITAQNAPGIAWTNVYIDGVYFASSPPLTFSWDSTNVANGSHTISANAYASGGTLAGSASVTVTVSNGSPKPAVTLTSPTNGSTVSGNVTLTAQVSASVAWIDFEVDGKFFASSPPLSTIWDSTGVADGSHALEAIAFNSADTQIGTSTATVTVANHVSATGGPIALRSTSIASTAAATTSLTINAPAGVSAGDVLIAQIAVTGGSSAPVTGPTGWLLAAHNNSTTSIVQAIYYHVVPASPAEPASYKWTWTGANNAAGGIADYENVSTVNPIDDVNGAVSATSSTTVAAPALNIPSTHTTDHLIAMFTAPATAGVTLPSTLSKQWGLSATGGAIEIAMGDVNLTSDLANAQNATLPAAAIGIGQAIALLPNNLAAVAFADRTSANAPGVAISGTNVSALVPFGSDDTNPVDAAQVPIESASGTLAASAIVTTDRVNSCATFASTGASMCSGQSGTVDFLAGGGSTATRMSDNYTNGGNEYTGGDCAACGIAVDDFLATGILASSGGFQLLNPANDSIGAPIPGNNEPVPVDFGYDPVGHRILSANYVVTNPTTFGSSTPEFEIFNLFRSSNEVFELLNDTAFFEPSGSTCTGSGGTSQRDILPDTTAIDTSTNIAYVTFHTPSNCFTAPIEDIALFDLSQATFTTSGGVGGWTTAGKQIQTLTGLTFGGVTAISVVSGAHVAIISGEFSSNLVGALKLPATSGSGTPAIADWVEAQMPNDPSGNPWLDWHQPDGLGSYTSPNNGKAYGVMMNFGTNASSAPIGPTYLAIVDLNALLSAPRDSTNHVVASTVNLTTSGIVRFVKVQ
jgi:hypothetical protein